MIMKSILPSQLVLKSLTLALLLIVSMPAPSRADALTSLMSALFGQGLGGGNNGFVNGDPANQVIPLLQQIYRQNADNGGTNLSTERLQTQTDIQRSTYEQQTAWERERRLRDDEIARSYPEMSNLSCAIATANQSAGTIEVAASNATGQAMDIITNGMYKSVFLATTVSAKYKSQIWCKLGATGKEVGNCDVEADKLVEGAHINPYKAIGVKLSIPCDMQSVNQEFQQMKNPASWTPNQRNKECIAALLSIANQYPISSSFPTKEEASNDNGTNLLDSKFNRVGMVGGTKGGLWEEFRDRVSVPIASTDCMKGIQGGAGSVYSLLQQKYSGTTRDNKTPPFGLPPSGFCLSKMLFREGKILQLRYNKEQQASNRDLKRVLEDLESATIEGVDYNNMQMASLGTGRNTNGLTELDRDLAARKVASDDSDNRELLSAIRQLTSAIQVMNAGVYSTKPQEVRLDGKAKKKIIPAISDKAAEVTDALKEMGLKVSAPKASSNGVLGPLTQEFPVLPPQ